jgi:RND family efflux transporter MFP subunit
MITILNKTKGLKLPLIAMAGLVFAVVTVFGRPAEPKSEPLVTPPTSSYQSAIAGIGVVEPQSEVISIGIDLQGLVRIVHVKVGDKVEAGAPLFTLDEREIDAQIKTLDTSLTAAKIQAQDAAAQFALVKNIEDKRAVAIDDVNRRKFASSLAKARIAEVEAQLLQAQTTKERLTIKAPIAGEILSVNVRPGEMVGQMGSEPLMRMGDTSILHVRAEIDEENTGKINSTAKAKGIKRGDTKTEIPLTFVRFEPFVRPKQNLAAAGQRVDTRVLQVIYAIGETSNPPFVGEQMDVFIDTEKTDKAE